MSEPPPIAAINWRYIASSLDRLVQLALEMPETERLERPPVEGANSLATLVGHTLANAEDNLLGTLLGREVRYERHGDFDTPVASAAEIGARWDALRSDFEDALGTLDDASVMAVREHPRRGEITGLEILIVTSRHAAEHLAHAELTRDWLRSRSR